MSNTLLRAVIVLGAAAAPLLRAPRVAGADVDAPPLPSSIEGRALRPVAPGAVEAAYMADFPGRIGKFEDGERTWVLRSTGAPTLSLHGSSRCLSAAGFAVIALPAARDASGAVWSRVRAERDGRAYVVRERVAALVTGASWPDVDAWRYDAWLGRDPGPWLALTAIEPVGPRQR